MTVGRTQFVTRKGKFDAGHRVMFERFKCANVHGHEYHYELRLRWDQCDEIGYAIDFKEIKRLGCQFFDDVFDHGFIANPKDEHLITACQAVGSKLYLMNLTDKDGFCNPTAENLAKEMFFAVSILLNDPDKRIFVDRIRLWETVNCYVDCPQITQAEWNFLLKSSLHNQAVAFKTAKGSCEYDIRKVPTA